MTSPGCRDDEWARAADALRDDLSGCEVSYSDVRDAPGLPRGCCVGASYFGQTVTYYFKAKPEDAWQEVGESHPAAVLCQMMRRAAGQVDNFEHTEKL